MLGRSGELNEPRLESNTQQVTGVCRSLAYLMVWENQLLCQFEGRKQSRVTLLTVLTFRGSTRRNCHGTRLSAALAMQALYPLPVAGNPRFDPLETISLLLLRCHSRVCTDVSLVLGADYTT